MWKRRERKGKAYYFKHLPLHCGHVTANEGPKILALKNT